MWRSWCPFTWRTCGPITPAGCRSVTHAVSATSGPHRMGSSLPVRYMWSPPHVVTTSCCQLFWSLTHVITASCRHHLMWSPPHVVTTSCGHNLMLSALLVTNSRDHRLMPSPPHVITTSCSHHLMWSPPHVVITSCGHYPVWSPFHVIATSCFHHLLWSPLLRPLSREFRYMWSQPNEATPPPHVIAATCDRHPSLWWDFGNSRKKDLILSPVWQDFISTYVSKQFSIT